MKREGASPRRFYEVSSRFTFYVLQMGTNFHPRVLTWGEGEHILINLKQLRNYLFNFVVESNRVICSRR